MRKTSFLLGAISLFLSLYLSSCNMPGWKEEASATPDITQAYETVGARLTESAAQTPSPSPTTKPSDTPVQVNTPSPTIPLAVTVMATTPAPTVVTKLCDQAEAGVPIDVTIPDDSNMAPEQVFTKVWRLRNSGTCTWNKNYSIAVFSGEPMEAPSSVPLPRQVEPGQTVDISVDLTAPNSAGSYQGNWKLKNAQGTWFGIGPGGNSPFWVRITVAKGTLTITPGTATPKTPTTAPATDQFNPPTLISGSNTLLANTKIDLDTNQLDSGGEDLSLKPNAQDRLVLNTIGNAGLAGFGSSAPTYGQCQSAGPGSASVAARNLPQGFYICYRTNQGLFGWLRVTGFDETAGTLNFQINTWALP